VSDSGGASKAVVLVVVDLARRGAGGVLAKDLVEDPKLWLVVLRDAVAIIPLMVLVLCPSAIRVSWLLRVD